MDRQLLERMIGAAVLIVMLVLVVPAILNGPRQDATDVEPAGLESEPLRRVTIRPDREVETPPVAQPVVPPDPAPSAPDEAEKRPPTPVVKPPAAATPAPVSPAPRPAARPSPPAATPAPAAPKAPEQEKAAPAEIGSGWVVQLGSFASRANAEALVARAASAGFQSYLRPLERAGQSTLYRVRVGPVSDSRDGAAKLAARLSAAGFKGQLARQQPGD